jgi:hypothetical protein
MSIVVCKFNTYYFKYKTPFDRDKSVRMQKESGTSEKKNPKTKKLKPKASW